MAFNQSNGDFNCSPNQLSYQATQREIVTVFWDYENCPCPMSTKISTLTYDIKRRIDHFLGKKLNKRIQLYCPMQRLHQKTREDSTDLGILMMDVASKRKQESVDKRIIADIGLFAAELAESKGNDIGHIVLISGDSDYGYILARLRDKAYIGKIIIFINDYTKDTLIQHADHTHCLFQSNLTRKENPFSDYNQRKLQPNGYSSPYSPYSRSIQNRSRTTDRFQLNGGYNSYLSHNDQSSSSKWNTTSYFPYQQPSTKSTNDHMYSNGHRSKTENTLSHKLPRNERRGYRNHNLNTPKLNGSTMNGGKSTLSRSRSPEKSYPVKQILTREIKPKTKVECKNNDKTPNNKTSYVYRKKEKDHSPKMNGADIKMNDEHIISAPPPIPPKPQSLKKSESNGSTSSTSTTKSNGSHRIVSQENLEEQLKQQQKERELKEKELKEKEKERLALIGSASPDVDECGVSAEIDGVRNKNNVSTFSVRPLYKINEGNDESNNGLSTDFFDTMIAPKEDDMDVLFKDIAPKVNVFAQNDGKRLDLPPKTDHIIDLEAIKLKSPCVSAPKKILIKKKIKGGHHNSLIAEQLRLVWDALCYCQKNGNSTPRRREICKAMKKTHSEYMRDKDMKFADECINACLSVGTVEEMIKGRISSLYILPVILNALTCPDSSFYTPTKEGNHVWITLESLKNHLKSRHAKQNILSSYLNMTYLYRIISNATRLFAFHKDDKKKNETDLTDEELKLIRFRVRKTAFSRVDYNNRSNSYAYFQNNHHQNNLTFNYYS